MWFLFFFLDAPAFAWLCALGEVPGELLPTLGVGVDLSPPVAPSAPPPPPSPLPAAVPGCSPPQHSTCRHGCSIAHAPPGSGGSPRVSLSPWGAVWVGRALNTPPHTHLAGAAPVALGVHSAKPLLASQFPALCRGSRRPYPPAAPPPPQSATLSPRGDHHPTRGRAAPSPTALGNKSVGPRALLLYAGRGLGGGLPTPPRGHPQHRVLPTGPGWTLPHAKAPGAVGWPVVPGGGCVCVCVSGPCRGEQGVRRGELLEGKGGAAAAGGGGVDPPLLAWGPRGATFVPLIAGGRGGRGGGCVPGVPRLLQLPPPPPKLPPPWAGTHGAPGTAEPGPVAGGAAPPPVGAGRGGSPVGTCGAGSGPGPGLTCGSAAAASRSLRHRTGS